MQSHAMTFVVYSIVVEGCLMLGFAGRRVAPSPGATFGKPIHPSCRRGVGVPKWPPDRP
jgi:hypothetical protein